MGLSFKQRIMLAVVLAALIMGMVTFGFGLLNVPGIVMSIFLGLLLIPVFYVVVRRLTGDKSDGTEATGDDVIRPFE